MTEKIQVPNFEATAERKKIYTLKQWLERFRHNTKRKHKIDIAEVIRGAEMTQTGWQKQTEIQEDFIWGIEPEALYHYELYVCKISFIEIHCYKFCNRSQLINDW